jgi:hypothetical protein
MNKTLLVLGALLLAGPARSESTFVDTSGLVADTSFSVDTVSIDTLPVDTVLYRPGQLLTPYRTVTDPENLEKRLSQNPTAALIKSVFIPGLGQLGNRRYIKAAIFMGLDAWFVGSAIHYGRQASDFYNQYESSTDIYTRNEYYDLYSDRKDERNKFTWFAVIVTFISMFDAYVDAHLSGFPQKLDEDRVSFNLCPSSRGEIVAYVSISF